MNRELLNQSLHRMLEYTLTEGGREFSVTIVAHDAEYHYRTEKGVARRGTISSAISKPLGEYADELVSKNIPIMLGTYSVYCTRMSNQDGRVFLFVIDPQSSERSAKLDCVPLPTDRPLIFLVDDNPDFSRVLDRFLARSDVLSESIGDARELMKKINEAPRLPDAIVCDLHMPYVSGFDVLESCRALELGIPIIILTSDESTESEIAAVQRGAALVLKKSHDPRVLVAHIERIARGRATNNLLLG